MCRFLFNGIKKAVCALLCLVCCSPKCSAQTADFIYYTTDKGLGVYTKNVPEGSQPELSLDGGEFFFGISGEDGFFSYLPENTYQLCMRYADDPSSVSNVYPVRIGQDSGDISIKCTGVREESYKSGCILVEIEDFDYSQMYMCTVNGGKTWTRMKNPEMVFDGISGGIHSVIVKNTHTGECSDTLDTFVPYPIRQDHVYLNAPVILQRPELPTGCEVTSLDMALRFYGFGIDKTILADYFLDKADYQTADFRDKFVGDPRTYMAYGCYSGVIVRCAHKFLDGINGRTFDILDLTGCDFDKVLSYVDMGYPVIVWSTMGLAEPVDGASWTDSVSGKTVTWLGNEHCMLLTGYDMNRGIVVVNDPLKGRVGYDEKLFRTRFDQLEKQAVVIVEITDMK